MRQDAGRLELDGARRACGFSSWMVIGSMGLMQAGAVAVAAALRFARGGFGNDAVTAMGCLSYLLLAVLPLAYVLTQRECPAGVYLPFSRPRDVGLTGGTAALLFVAGLGLVMAANWPSQWASQLLDAFGLRHAPSMPPVRTPAGLALGLFYSAAAAPLTEEILFRGVVLGRLRRFGDGFAILISALLFGLYHGNLEQFAFAVPVGVVLAYLRLRLDSILPCILLHAANNFLATFYDTVRAVWGGAAANAYLDAYFLAALLAGAAALLLLVVRRRSRRGLPLAHRAMCAPLRARAARFFLSGGGWTMLALGVLSAAATMLGVLA